jgi:hypothetical protein
MLAYTHMFFQANIIFWCNYIFFWLCFDYEHYSETDFQYSLPALKSQIRIARKDMLDIQYFANNILA